MFADPNEPFSAVTEELLELLRDRYADGLSAMIGDPKKLPVPAKTEESEIVVDYGILANPVDPAEGWTDLEVSDGKATVASKNVEEGTTLAFMIRGVDDASHDFIVESTQPARADDEDEDGDDTMMAVDDDDDDIEVPIR
ncbi:hypothetical protein MKZ38_007311 [Zalerion maritima]|uniref:Uncharacterized protein n=1 Tax=Zalerion maritima TaxID=339359 RepID=A0AAD5RJ20_9PEZI|nr:hypothetical protein MKZ38_007311 [Zalerion maritima]